MQSVSSRIWTRVAVSISYDVNYYTTGTLYIEAGVTPQQQRATYITSVQTLYAV